MKRRSLLKSIIGASAGSAMPLSWMLARSAIAQGDGAAPARVLFLYHPNGCVHGKFFPEPGTVDLKEMSAPLSSVKQHCVFLDGITMFNGGGSHEGGADKALTANGSTSLDVVIGNHYKSQTQYSSLQLGVLANLYEGKNPSFANGTRLPYQDNPITAYERIFAGATGGGGDGAAMSNAGDLNILASVKDDLARMRTLLGQQERERLELHEDSLAQLEQRLIAKAGGGEGGGGGGGSCGEVDTSGVGPDDGGNNEAITALSRIQQDITIQALACDMSRSVSFMYSHPVSPAVVPGGPGGDHDASHVGGGTHVSSKVWWMSEIATFIEKMAATPDMNGSLLDNTLVVQWSEIGDGSLHDHNRVPFVLCGGKNLGLVGGRTLDFRKDPAGTQPYQWEGAPHSHLLALIGQKMGVPMDSFGDGTGVLDGVF